MIYLILFFALILVFFCANIAYKHTNHYKNRYHRVAHLQQIGKDELFDIVNLGSSQPFFGFDYSDIPSVKGANWAVYPQYFEMDYAVLQQFSNHIKKKGIVIITISLLNFFSGAENIDGSKYYPILRNNLIFRFSWIDWLNCHLPLLFRPHYIMFVIKDLQRVRYTIEDSPCVTEAEYEADADGYIKRWNQGFGIEIPSLKLSETNKMNFEKNMKLLKNMSLYCKQQGLRPVFVMLPTTDVLANRFTEEFVDQNVNDCMSKVLTDEPYLNYFGDKRYMQRDWYMTSFFLNKKGRREMTKIIFEDIKKAFND